MLCLLIFFDFHIIFTVPSSTVPKLPLIVLWLEILRMQSSKQESVGWDSCPQATDIVVWQYINPQRTHESFHCPLVEEGQLESYRAALPAKVPQGSSTGKTLSIMRDWTWTFPNHYISLLPVDICWVRMWHLKQGQFLPSCIFLIYCFFRTQVFFLQSVPIHFKPTVHLLRLRHAACWLEPPSFISPLSLLRGSDSSWSLRTARDYLIVPSGSSNSLLIPALPLFKQAHGS